LFDWQLFVQGGSFDQSFSLGKYQSGDRAYSYAFPADSYLYHLAYSSGSRDSCRGSVSVTVNDNVYSGSGGMGHSASKAFPYDLSTSLQANLHGSDNKVSGVSGSLSGRSCHYRLAGSFKFGVEIYADATFVNRREQEKNLGPISQYVPAGKQLQAGQVYRAFSQNPSIMMWFGTPDSINTTTTTDETLDIWACEDLDQEGTCDWIQSTDGQSQGGAWYAGRCCGVDRDTPTCAVYDDFVQRDFAGNVIKNITFAKPAVCGLNIDGDPEWAYIQDVGGVHELIQCPDLNLVSDGAQYYHCGNDISSPEFRRLAPSSFEKLEVTVGSIQHTFTCVNSTITECHGNDLPMSGINTVSSGGILPTTTGPEYCQDGGTSGVDLDGSQEACKNAIDLIDPTQTEKWTGHYCCSEDLDTADDMESYNDPFDPAAFSDPSESSAGGCWNREWTQAGTYLLDKKIINAQGVYYACGAADPSYMSVMDSHTNTPVVQQTPTCGKLDLGQIGRPDGTHAVCQPWGEFTLTFDTAATLIKDIQWNVSAVATNLTVHDQGCCPENQCWNGNDCQEKGTYYQVAETGFLCN
jgi:hypothetical protein